MYLTYHIVKVNIINVFFFNEIKLPSVVKFMKISHICLSLTLIYTPPIENRTKMIF